MVRTSKKQLRYAFTLIELIFAIVIIAISVMSLPMMAQVNAKGMENNMVQEAIYISSGNLLIASSQSWDEETNVENAEYTDPSLIIDIDNTCTGTPKKRPGHIARKCRGNTHQGGSLQDSNKKFEHDFREATEEDDNVNYAAAKATAASDYKKKYRDKVETDNNLIPFGEVGNLNTRETKNTVADKDDNEITLLRAYKCNIGEAPYLTEGLQ